MSAPQGLSSLRYPHRPFIRSRKPFMNRHSADFPALRKKMLIGSLGTFFAHPAMALPKPAVEVWKSPACGCCKEWIARLEMNGFAVAVHDTDNNAVRLKLGLPATCGSCHTATVGGYVIEGHVPVREIRRPLRGKPVAVGLAVPGMPVGSPGMDGPAYNNRKDAYDVLLVARDGLATVFQTYRP
jgi:hypothetical protein